MRLSETQVVQAITELLEEGTVRETHLRENIVGFLKKHKLLREERKVLAALERGIDEAEGRVRVTVHSARTLEPEEETLAMRRASELFPGKTIVLQYRINPGLIGGIAFETDNVRYDATLARSIHLLSQSL